MKRMTAVGVLGILLAIGLLTLLLSARTGAHTFLNDVFIADPVALTRRWHPGESSAMARKRVAATRERQRRLPYRQADEPV